MNDKDAPYAISGEDTVNRTSGVLEWCYSGDDAVRVFNSMAKYPQFKNLAIERNFTIEKKTFSINDRVSKYSLVTESTHYGKVVGYVDLVKTIHPIDDVYVQVLWDGGDLVPDGTFSSVENAASLDLVKDKEDEGTYYFLHPKTLKVLPIEGGRSMWEDHINKAEFIVVKVVGPAMKHHEEAFKSK
jgi:hypothetical protein